jgi:hypothetical protein
VNKFTPKNAEAVIISILDGITIDWSDEYKNRSDSILVNREFDSNEIDESDWQFVKHDDFI